MPRVRCPACTAVHAFAKTSTSEVIRCTNCHARVRLPELSIESGHLQGLPRALQALLADSDPGKRIKAVEEAREQAIADAKGPCITLAMFDPDREVREKALSAWRELEDRWIAREIELWALPTDLGEALQDAARAGAAKDFKSHEEEPFLNLALCAKLVEYYMDERPIQDWFLSLDQKMAIMSRVRRQGALLDRLRSRLSREPGRLLWALAELRCYEDVEAAREALYNNSDVEVQLSATYYLVRCRDTMSAPFFLRRIEDIFGQTDEEISKESSKQLLSKEGIYLEEWLLRAFQWGITRVSHPGTRFHLLRFLAMKNMSLQLFALRALDAIGQTEAMLSCVPDLLDGRQAEILIETLRILERQNNVDVYINKIFDLLAISDEMLRKALLDVVIRHQKALWDDVEACVKLLEKPEIPPSARIDLLARLELKSETPKVAECLDDDEPEVRVKALKALVELDARRLIPRIRDLLDDSTPAVRVEAVKTIIALDEQGCADILRRALDNEAARPDRCDDFMLEIAWYLYRNENAFRAEKLHSWLSTEPAENRKARRAYFLLHYRPKNLLRERLFHDIRPDAETVRVPAKSLVLRFNFSEHSRRFLDAARPLIKTGIIKLDLLIEEFTLGSDREIAAKNQDGLDRVLLSPALWKNLYLLGGKRNLRFRFILLTPDFISGHQAFVGYDAEGFKREVRRFSDSPLAGLYSELVAIQPIHWNQAKAQRLSDKYGALCPDLIPPARVLPVEIADYADLVILDELAERILVDQGENLPAWFET